MRVRDAGVDPKDMHFFNGFSHCEHRLAQKRVCPLALLPVDLALRGGAPGRRAEMRFVRDR